MDFWDALEAGAAKINEYYEKTAESDAYTFSMCTFHRFEHCLLSNDSKPST